MPEILSFPGLGLQFEINRIAFSIGSRPIYWYGIIIALAFLAAASYALTRAKVFGLDNDRVMDVILGAVILGIVGARLYYVVFRWDTYMENPLSIFDLRAGGIAIYGGIIGGVIAAMIVCKWRQVKLLPMLDLAAGSLLLGQAIGRWGNFINIEVFGGNTSAPWGMTSPSISWYLKQNIGDLQRIGMSVDPSLPVHPTFFYESAWCLLGFIFMLWYTSRRRFDGELGLIYLGWYGLGRFFIEGLRTDSLLLGTMRVSQILALLCVIASVIALVSVRSKIKRANDPEYLKLYVETDEAAAILRGEFYKKKDAAKAEEQSADEVDTEEDGSDEENPVPDTKENSAADEAFVEEQAAPDTEEKEAETDASEDN